MLYEYCATYITPAQFVKFLDALEYSRNFAALLILDPDRKINPVPVSIEIPPPERTHIHSGDIARILHDKSFLPRRWTILKEVLQLDEDEWNQAVQMDRTHQLFDVIEFIIDTWCSHFGQLGLDSPTVGFLCDSLHSLGHRTAAGKQTLKVIRDSTHEN
jgi:hypothetical protein